MIRLLRCVGWLWSALVVKTNRTAAQRLKIKEKLWIITTIFLQKLSMFPYWIFMNYRLTSIEISEDSSLMFTGFGDSNIKVWSLTPSKLRCMKQMDELELIDKETGKLFIPRPLFNSVFSVYLTSVFSISFVWTKDFCRFPLLLREYMYFCDFEEKS